MLDKISLEQAVGYVGEAADSHVDAKIVRGYRSLQLVEDSVGQIVYEEADSIVSFQSKVITWP